MADLFRDDKQLAIVRQQQGARLEQIFTRVALHFKPASLEFLARQVLSAHWDPEAAAGVRARVGSWLSRALADLQGQYDDFQGPGHSDHIWNKHAIVRGWLAKWENFIAEQPQNVGHQPQLSFLLEFIDVGTTKMDELEADHERGQADAEARVAREHAAKEEACSAAVTALRTPPHPHERLAQDAPQLAGVDACSDDHFPKYAEFCRVLALRIGRRDM
jgi:hypothetical protein